MSTLPVAGAARLPFVIVVLAIGTFLMGTTEFIIAGLLPEIAQDLRISAADAGLLITVFAIGMIVGTPTMTIATLRLTLTRALVVFAIGHVVVRSGQGSGCSWRPGPHCSSTVPDCPATWCRWPWSASVSAR